MNQIQLYSHPDLLKHGHPEHPENAQRLKAILEAVEGSEFKKDLILNCKRRASLQDLVSNHDPKYVQEVLDQAGHFYDVDHETRLTPDSVPAAQLATGLGLEMIEDILAGKTQMGFSLIRPPGHHSRPERGMGFCFFNSIAIAARAALKAGVKKLLILDWDVHHGNGTQDSFYDDDRVLFIDLHQDKLFPKDTGAKTETGSGKGKGFTLNIPLPHSCTDVDYLYVFENLVHPWASHFHPELILVSAGFDAHEKDPLASMSVTTNGFGHFALQAAKIAKTYCDGKLGLFLEGGYLPEDLSANVLAVLRALTQNKTQPLRPDDIQTSVISLANELRNQK